MSIYFLFLSTHLGTILWYVQAPTVHGPALYAKAAEIAWKHTSKYANIILRMDTFHTIMTSRNSSRMLACAKPESGIIAEGV